MAAFLMTLAALVLMLLTIRGLMRRSRFAIGLVAGAIVVLICTVLGWSPFGSFTIEEVPLWLPPLPFATVAVVLFVFGLLAWFRSED